MNGPLTGIRVVEFTGIGPAPLAGQLLADLGADVIVVDRKSAELNATDVNRRGKRSIALNLKTTEGRAAILKVLDSSDVLIEGFRPGVMEKLGLGPANVPETLIYGRMTGWGQEGPLAQTAGHDMTYLALTGALNMFGSPGRPPHPSLNYVADFGGGAMFLVFGILAALLERVRSGKGQVVDAAMVDGVAAMGGLINMIIANGFAGEARGQNFLDGSAPYYRCYECADKKYIAVGCIEPQFFAEFLSLAGLPAGDARIQNEPKEWADMHSRYETHFRTKSRDEWATVFEGSDACVSPVLTLSEAPEHPHIAARNIFSRIEGTIHPAPAPRFSRSEVRDASVPVAAGSSTEAVLQEVGFAAKELVELRKSSILT